ncbi:hypothetical protein K0T92_20385 [Paenibacillus oenotherae]|uniref:F-box associated domain-containing protein n=1 Tax=Paenibacillus oenotherae TaxID=1435645 RepID=A0ABS7DAV6_9BACL|nr:hypothetical protein [Paenibacillus oenotherae]MBW7477080.1 hypothetical protein [Paenibacillus oenotherae]
MGTEISKETFGTALIPILIRQVLVMLNILRVNGFHNKSIFFLGECEEKALDFSGLLYNGAFYCAWFSHEKALMHIHRVEFGHVQSSQITVSLTDVLGNSTVYRTEMRGIDDRYCLVGCSTSNTYETTDVLLIDFEDNTYTKVAPDFGIDTLLRIERIMTIKSTPLTPRKEEIVLLTGGFHLREKYGFWENRERRRGLEDKLMEYVVIFERDSFFHRLKSGLPLEVMDKQIIERCPLHKSIILHDGNGTTINYTVIDFG